jgi:hypothetical protein
MMRSKRFFLVLGMGFSIGLAGLGVLLVDSTPALSLESLALHAPPAGYQPVGPCIPHLGQPYQRTDQQPDAPILFYRGNELTKLSYFLKERDIQNGRTLTLLNELGGLPIANMTFSFSRVSPAPKGNPLNKQLQGPHYEFSIYLWQLGIHVPC